MRAGSRTFNLWLLLVVVLCGLSLWYGRSWRPSPGEVEGEATFGGATPPTTGAQRGDSIDEDKSPVHVAVLNGTTVPGLAREFSLLLVGSGCVAEKVGNAPRQDVARTILVNRTLPGPKAEALARLLGGVPVVKEWDSRTCEDAVLVLGRDFAEVRDRLGTGK